ncbi:MAG: lamin tail domain-containing protein, partial [Endomicrobiales bacterium]
MTGYLIKHKSSSFTSPDDFLATGATYPQTLAPSSPGVTQDYTLSGMLPEGATFYVGIAAMDKAGNTGNLLSGSTNQYWSTRVRPAQITNLAGSVTEELDPGSVKLAWTAVGDDDRTGTASGYLVKYASYPFTEASWNAVTVSTATQAWTPQTAGSPETRVVAGLTAGNTYYFAIKAYDAAAAPANYSVISNTVSVAASPKGPADGIACFAQGALANPRYFKVTAAGAAWSQPYDASNAAATIYWSVLRTCPVVRNEKLLGTLSSNGALYLQQWNGPQDSWAPAELQTTIASADAVYRPFDIAYEQNSGRALVAYRSGSAGQVYYRVWSSTASAWVTPTATLVVGGTGLVRWVRLEPRPGTDEMMLVTLDANSVINACRWNGSAWQNNRQLTLSAFTPDYQSFDTAWENSPGNCLILWGEGTTTRYAMWSSTAALWSLTGAAGPDIVASNRNGANWIKLAADRAPGSNRIALSCLDSNSDWNVSVWGGTSWPAPTELSANMVAATPRAMDVAWEKDSGECLAVGVLSGQGSYVSHATWNGSWSAAATYSAYNLGNSLNLKWLQLTPDPNSNKIVLLGANAGAAGAVTLRSLNWTATGWAGGIHLLSNGSNGAYEFFMLALNQYDTRAPFYANNQEGDNIWRSTNTAKYDVHFYDDGGSHLSKAQTLLSLVPGGSALSAYRSWQDELTGLNTDSYVTDWALLPGTWNQLQRGKTYVSLQVFDGVGNTLTLTDAFYVLKDTEPPQISNVLPASSGWYSSSPDAGVIASAGFADQAGLSLLTTAQYLIYPQPGRGGTQICQGTIFNFSPGTSAKTANIALGTNPNQWDLLANSTNYVTLQCYDVAGNTRTLVDAFKIFKDTIPPQAITTLNAAKGPYRGTITLSWTAPGDDGLTGRNLQGSYLIKYATYPLTALALFKGASAYAQALVPRDPQALETITLTGLDPGTTFYFSVSSTDKALLESAISNSTGTVPRLENIYLNEIYAAGAAGADWVELYSNLPYTQSLNGWTLVYNQGSLGAPGAEITVWTGGAGDSISSGSFKAAAALDIDGTASHFLVLRDTYVPARTVDVVQWPASSAGRSMARITDGNFDFLEIDPTPTPGYANSIATGTIKINEIDYASARQFIELYNVAQDTPALAGWTLRNSQNVPFQFTRKLYPQSFSGIGFSSVDNNSRTWVDCFGAGGLSPAADFLALENPSGQAVDRVTWKTGSNTQYYTFQAAPAAFSNAAPGGAEAPATVGRRPSEGADTGNNIEDFISFAAPTLGLRNNNPVPALANTIAYPASDSWLPRRFKLSFALGSDSSGGTSDTLWFVRTGGTADPKSPHIYRLKDIGFDLSTLSAQTTVQAGLSFADMDGNPLAGGAAYTMLLNTDNAAGAAQAARSVTYETAVHDVQAASVLPSWCNNGAPVGVFRIDVRNQSPAGAGAIEFSSVTIRFTDGQGTPLTTGEAQELFSKLSLVADSASAGTAGAYQSGIDTATLASAASAVFSLDGSGTLVLGAGNPDAAECRIAAQATRTYFLAARLTGTASSSVPNTFKAGIVPGTGAALRDSLSDVEQDRAAGSLVQTSSPTVVEPVPPPSGTAYPAPVAAPGTEINGFVALNSSGTTAFAAASDGKVYAVNSDGSNKWVFDAGSPVRTVYEASMYEPDPYLYLATDNGTLYKIQDNGAGASPVWAPRNMGSRVTTDIIPLDDFIYVGTENGGFYKISTSGADAPNWTSSPGISGSVSGTPVIDNFPPGVNAIWVGSTGGVMYRLSNVYGTVTVSSETASPINTAPFLVGGYLDPAKNAHTLYFGDDAGTLRCRNSSNLEGKPADWVDLAVGAAIRGSPVYDYITFRYVYFGADNGVFYKVDASSGGIYWSFQTGRPIRTAPVLGDNNDVYFGSDDGCFYGLDTRDGQILPRFPVITGGEVRGSPFYDAGYDAYDG